LRRRDFLAVGGGVTTMWPLAARAQQHSMAVIGVLSPESPTATSVEGLQSGLRDLGYIEGRNIRYEYRWSAGSFDKLPAMAAELVALKVDVIVAFVTDASLVAKRATSSIPIVMVAVADPVGVGLVDSLAHPGGNVTGTASIAAVLAAKQLEFLQTLLPGLSRVAALWNPTNLTFQTLQVKQAQTAAKTLGIELELLEARSPGDFDAAFATIDREGTRALLILVDPMFIINSQKLVEFSTRNELAAITGARTFVDAGGLMTYGPNYRGIYRLSATYVDEILKGTKPADLPVQQPTKFELVINLKTAKALGLNVPPTLLARADEVIE
jgi:putative tryptophan/tyrosine transport system substrate-binding protein